MMELYFIWVALVALVAVLVFIWKRWREWRESRKRRRLAQRERSPDRAMISESRSCPTTSNDDNMRFSLERLLAATNSFAHELGRGAFGQVYKGTLDGGREIAVKKLLANEQGFKNFEAEVKTLGSINHGNLVALLGFCSKSTQSYLIYEYVLNGSLDKLIFGRDKVLPWRTRVQIMRGTAKGLEYLHHNLQVEKVIVHLDIKPENILLDHRFEPKIADFGMAKLVGLKRASEILASRGTVRASGGTAGYMAPEVLQREAATPSMDVYSFGMVMLEVLSGRPHLDNSLPIQESYLPAWAIQKVAQEQVLHLIDRAVENVDEKEAKRLVATALLCLHSKPEMRPTISNVLRMIEGNAMPPGLPPELKSDLQKREKIVLGASPASDGRSAPHFSDLLRFSSSENGESSRENA